MYTFTERCHEFSDMELEDRTKKIFLNMTSKNGRDELVSFLQYCKNSTLDNPEITILDERLKTLDAMVSEVKQNEEWEVARMSILSTGIEIGEKKGIIAMIRMGREFHLSDDAILEQICKSFDLDQAAARKYLDTFEK